MDKIAILDFGGQYAHLIGNRIRRLGVYTEILDGDTLMKDLIGYKGIILSGGPASVGHKDSPKCDPAIFDLNVPVLGICYGHQLMALTLGGRIDAGKVSEYGHAHVSFEEKKDVFVGVEDSEDVWMSHFDQVVTMPDGFDLVASTDDCPIAAMADYERLYYSLQFHPEVTHTACGKIILENFVNLTHAKREWDIETYINDVVEDIKQKVGDKKVFLLVSGGVDSTVAFLLLDKALGQEKVYGLYVDTGFMRLGESAEVESSLKGIGIENLHVYDGGKDYFEALKGVYEPEAKRKIIGDLFLDIQRKVSDELGLNPEEWIIAQGTIYPDTIETGGTKHSHTIKTHHNRVEAVQKLIEEGKVIEPLSQLYKDEVRLVGEKLGLRHDMVWRHPFPGPGLAVRCLCAEAADLPENVAEVEAKMNELVGDKGYKAKVLPIKSVGVQGDERTYRHPAVLLGKLEDWGELSILGTRLTNQFPEINRVVLGLRPTSFEGMTIQNSYLNYDRILLNQKVDKMAMDFIFANKMGKEIWQMPTVLIPLSIDSNQGESVVLRPVCSEEAMTASFYRMNFTKLGELADALLAVEGITGVFYDITNKPPGTIEWE